MTTFVGASLNSHKPPRRKPPVSHFEPMTVRVGPAAFAGGYNKEILGRLAWTPHRVARLTEKVNAKGEGSSPLLREVAAVNAARHREITVYRSRHGWELREWGVTIAQGSEGKLIQVLHAKDNRDQYVIPARPKALQGMLDGEDERDALSGPQGYGNMFEATLNG